jgi:hypothetical protein
VTLVSHLLEDRLGDVVVAAPVRGPLGERELVEVVTGRRVGDGPRRVVYGGRVVDEVTGSALALDEGDLLGAGRPGHHRDERQSQHPCEVGLGHRGRAARRLGHGGAWTDVAVADRVEEQRARQSVLEAAGRVGRFVLEVQIDVPAVGQRHVDQMGVRAAVGVGADAPDRLIDPRAVDRTSRGNVDEGLGASGAHNVHPPSVRPIGPPDRSGSADLHLAGAPTVATRGRAGSGVERAKIRTLDSRSGGEHPVQV